ncbi:MAG: hypothetical protein ABSH08_03885 [Tepidisphaeraceae bacterium]|jgi:hypothetical protein
MRRNAKKVAVVTAAVGGMSFLFSQTNVASASILPGTPDVIYSDNFAAPAVNVNAPNTYIVNNAPAVETGLDGGSASATYVGVATIGVPAANSDALWSYSGSNSATITSPAFNGNGEDNSTIDNLTLPLSPIIGETYDLELTMTVPSATHYGGHGVEMAFLYGNGNGHNTAGQAISNNDPAGLILDRDFVTGTGYFDVFEGIGTANDNRFSPGTGLGSTLTVDTLYTPTSTTSGVFSWYANGVLLAGPVTITGITGGITDVQFGTNYNTAGGNVLQNFSLTDQVPEPVTAGLFLASGLPLMFRRHRKVKA